MVEDIQGCLANPDFESAFDCIKGVVSRGSDSDECRPKLVLLTQENCPGCEEGIARHQGDIDRGVIEEIRVDSPKGMEIIKANGIDYVPALLLLDCHDNIILPV